MERTPEVEDLLPLKPVDFLVLLVLSDRERHGYGIVQDIAEHTHGRIRLVPGNLYSVLRRLLAAGLLAEGARRPTREAGDERRRYYHITALGKHVLQAEAERMRELVVAAEARDILNRPETA